MPKISSTQNKPLMVVRHALSSNDLHIAWLRHALSFEREPVAVQAFDFALETEKRLVYADDFLPVKMRPFPREAASLELALDSDDYVAGDPVRAFVGFALQRDLCFVRQTSIYRERERGR